MKLDNILKIVWLINGLVLIGFLLAGLVMVISELNFGSSTPYTAGKDQESEKLNITLSYESPIGIYGTNYFLMGVGFTQYDRGSDKGASIDSYFSSEDNTYHNCANIIFLDKNYKPVRTLLTGNAFIESFEFPTDYAPYEYGQKPDSTIKHIIYLIAFKDTDEDGDLNESDDADLYISDLDGNNLVQVTRAQNILKHQFVDNGRKIFIEFLSRDESDNSYRTLFAVYHIAEKRLEELPDIQESLNGIEKIVSQ